MTWLDGFTRTPISNRWAPRRAQLGRAHRAPVRKGLLHTTEGSSAAGAIGAYTARAGRFSGGVHPHVTVDPWTRARHQHVPLNRAAYALKAGDRDGVIQIEIVARAADIAALSDTMLDWLGTDVIAPITAAVPTIPLIAPHQFLSPAAGLLAAPWPAGAARLSPAQWAATVGWVGHQHAWGDDHWDPGPIDIHRILTAATTTGYAKEEAMFMRHHTDTDTWEVFVPGRGSATVDSPDHWQAVIAAGRATGVYASPYFAALDAKIGQPQALTTIEEAAGLTDTELAAIAEAVADEITRRMAA